MMVCVSLRATSVEDALKAIGEASEADLLEVRGDCFRSVDGLEQLAVHRDKLVVSVRRRRDGGFFNGSEQERAALLTRLLELRPKYVDLEVDSRLAKSLLCEARELGVKVIISYHNLERTPDLGELMSIWENCAALSPDVVKVVTKALKPEDNLVVLNLIPKASKPTVAFCMGALGRPSRILAPLFGSPFTYASLRRGLETAPGQLTLQELKEAWRLMAW